VFSRPLPALQPGDAVAVDRSLTLRARAEPLGVTALAHAHSVAEGREHLLNVVIYEGVILDDRSFGVSVMLPSTLTRGRFCRPRQVRLPFSCCRDVSQVADNNDNRLRRRSCGHKPSRR
jgi:hypothetical protein